MDAEHPEPSKDYCGIVEAYQLATTVTSMNVEDLKKQVEIEELNLRLSNVSVIGSQQLIDIEPWRELVILNNSDSANLTLNNPTGFSIVFSVWSNTRDKYCVRPNMGEIGAGEQKTLTVIHRSLLKSTTDVLMVESSMNPEHHHELNGPFGVVTNKVKIRFCDDDNNNNNMESKRPKPKPACSCVGCLQKTLDIVIDERNHLEEYLKILKHENETKLAECLEEKEEDEFFIVHNCMNQKCPQYTAAQNCTQ
ncbi:unnamed protein product [Caenorhabditis bovis]|uniref:Major sperm protein n=1 Tax=Caenorhabditis bovis TaxID=2654633 RepID=A0A8S1F5M2_9PELO|nr:unnamed protein product [Caenorhabditis bovis]